MDDDPVIKVIVLQDTALKTSPPPEAIDLIKGQSSLSGILLKDSRFETSPAAGGSNSGVLANWPVMRCILLKDSGMASDNTGSRSLCEVKVKIEVQEEENQRTGGDEWAMEDPNQEERMAEIMQKDDGSETEELSQVKVEGDRPQDTDTPYGINQPEVKERKEEENDKLPDTRPKWDVMNQLSHCVIS